EAIANLKNAVSLKPDYLEAWSQLGSAYTNLKEYEQGISAYKKALELAPDDEGLIASIGYNYLYLENWDQAEGFYHQLIEKDSLNYDGNIKLGYIAQNREDINGAIRYYEKALSVNGTDAVTMGTLAGLYDQKGNKEKKYEYLNRAVEAAPDNHTFKKQLAKAYFLDRDYVNSIPVYESLIEVYPDVADYYKRLGFALSQVDRKNEAPPVLERAIELGSRDAFTFALLSKIYNENKMSAKAINAAQQGLEAEGGEEAFLNYQWGVALSDLGNYEEAIVKFERVVSMKDQTWSDPASKQIKRQNDLIKIRKAREEQEKYE
ncbi:MAG: tetratricopeptide repeat protein, partial [Candidatus Krumholzibacteriota bacterium]|nr:tetratricopeptide repeat protein [Candidatus Krumholzibacteriota bacterium]